MKLAIMLEGQDGLTWERWQRWARAVEDMGFAGLFRSDHFTNANPPNRDSLELWTSLTWLAANSRRIEFGPLVTPVSFRHPVFTARMAKDMDDLSGGRLRLGVGAGWQVREHEMFGFDLLPVRERVARFEEGLEVITRLLRAEGPVSFSGRYYRLNEAVLLPRPARAGGPPIVVGGNGKKATLPLAARFADEWNAVLIPPERFALLNARLTELLQAQGRDPAAVRRTMMNNLTYARDEAELSRLLAGRDLDLLRARGVITGASSEVVDRLGEFAAAGVEMIMLQWLELDDFDRLEHFAAQVLPQVQRG